MQIDRVRRYCWRGLARGRGSSAVRALLCQQWFWRPESPPHEKCDEANAQNPREDVFNSHFAFEGFHLG
jgi:hypothetical protein